MSDHYTFDSAKRVFNDSDYGQLVNAMTFGGRLRGTFYAEVTYDPSSLPDGTGETKAVTVPGVALGDKAFVVAPYDEQDITVTCYVQGADTVEIRVQNESGSTHNLASGTWKILVWDLT